MVEGLVQDVRYAIRGIRRSPLFAASVAATIGLGLGILCSAFTILNAHLLRPLDLPDAHQLYSLSWDTETTQRRRLTLADFDEVRQDAPPFSSLVARREAPVMQDEVSLPGMLVTGDYFQVLGGQPALLGPAAPGGAVRDGARAALLPGRVVAGRYRLVHPLGQGAMGEVWCAHDSVRRFEVALKFLVLPRHNLAIDAMERFRFEAQVAAQLGRKTDFIVTVHDAGEDPEAGPYLVMEYVRGRSLRQLIHERGRLAELKAARGNIDRVVADVFALLRVDAEETVDGLTAAACEDAAFDRQSLMLAMQAWSQGSETERKKARTLADWLAGDPVTRAAAFESHSCLFLTQKGEMLKRLLTKQPAAAFPGALEAMQRDVPTVSHRAPLEEAMAAMQAASGPIGVVDGSGRLVGLLTQENLGEMLMVEAARARRPSSANPWARGA